MSVSLTKRTPVRSVASVVFVVLLAQLLAVIYVCFLMQRYPVYVIQAGVQFDYFEFYKSAHQVLHGINPYEGGRMFMPPSSIVTGFLLCWLPWGTAAWAFFVLNFLVLLLALKRLADVFTLSDTNRLLLYGIALIYFPVLFLLQRGNLDGIMLALIVFAMTTHNRVLRGILLGLSLAMKLYSGLFLVLLAAKRKWGVIATSVAVFFVMQAPFYRIFVSFVEALTGRAYKFKVAENISPSSLVDLVNPTAYQLEYLFYVVWALLLVIRIKRDVATPLSKSWPLYLPWMFTFPSLVFPYTGVLGLGLLAYIISQSQRRRLYTSEFVVVVGFLLLGFQGTAWSAMMHLLIENTLVMYQVCALGSLVMLIGTTFMPAPGGGAEPAAKSD
jgi:hypothetical protein